MTSPSLKLDFRAESWPFAQPFRIARGVNTEARVIVVSLSSGERTGRGEAVPIARYHQTVESCLAELEQVRSEHPTGLDRQLINKLLSAGAVRNALDCAFWDLESKNSGKRAWELANIPAVEHVVTAYTISLDHPELMAEAAREHRDLPLLKLKLGGDALDLDRVTAVREAVPGTRLIVDANESWSPAHYQVTAPRVCSLGVELIEQPFPAKADDVLLNMDHPVPVCADESCHTTADLPQLAKRYDAINVKLDKTGGLTEALRLAQAAREQNLKVMTGCMVGTSLGMAPARILAGVADYVDLDGPLLLAKDREHGLGYERGQVSLPSRELWG